MLLEADMREEGSNTEDWTPLFERSWLSEFLSQILGIFSGGCLKGFALMQKDRNYMYEFGMKRSIHWIFYRPKLPDVLTDLNQSLGALSQIQITVPENTMPTLRESAHQPQQEGPSQPQEDLIQPVQASLLKAFFYHIRYLNSRIGIWRESNKWVDKCMAIDSLGNYKDFIL